MPVIGGNNPTVQVTVPVPAPAPMKKPRPQPRPQASPQPVPTNPESEQQQTPQGLDPTAMQAPQQPEPRAILFPWAPEKQAKPKLPRRTLRMAKRKYARVKLYRGVSPETGTKSFRQGKGLYFTSSKNKASGYGDVVDVDQEFLPKNPLQLRSEDHWDGWLTDQYVNQLGLKNIREFNAKYPDPGEYVKSLGYDGIKIGSGHNATYVSYNAPHVKWKTLDQNKHEGHMIGKDNGTAIVATPEGVKATRLARKQTYHDSPDRYAADDDLLMDFGISDTSEGESTSKRSRPPVDETVGRTRKQILQQMLEAAKRGHYDPSGMAPHEYIQEMESKEDVPQFGGDVWMSDPEDEDTQPKQYNRGITYPRI